MLGCTASDSTACVVTVARVGRSSKLRSVDSSWDPERDPRPVWRPAQVRYILRGLEPDREPTRFARGGESEVLYPLDGLVFPCSCTARDDEGWAACSGRLHSALSKRLPTGSFVRRYLRLRGTFDAVLAEPWSRRGREPHCYAEYYEAQARRRRLPFEQWKLDHDLCGQPIWLEDRLSAVLDHTPIDSKISIYTLRRNGIDELAFELIDQSGFRSLPESATTALPIIFGTKLTES